MAIYHEHTREESLRKRRFRDIMLWVLLLLAILGILGYRTILGQLHAQESESIKRAVSNAAEQCYAIEGAYPNSLDYLVEKYGLRINEKDYVVNYVVFASNVQPSIVVMAR